MIFLPLTPEKKASLKDKTSKWIRLELQHGLQNIVSPSYHNLPDFHFIVSFM
jgi:hypothetical protein